MIELMTGTFMGMPIWLLGIQLSVPIVVFAWLVKRMRPSERLDWIGILWTSLATFYLMIAATVVVYVVMYATMIDSTVNVLFSALFAMAGVLVILALITMVL